MTNDTTSTAGSPEHEPHSESHRNSTVSPSTPDDNTVTDRNSAAQENERLLRREIQKNNALFFIIGGVISFELGRLFIDLHVFITMIATVVAVVLSLYGFFHYFNAYR